MTPEIGQLCLILALCVAAIQSVLPVAGAQFGNPAWIAVARPAAVTQLLFIALAFICLSWAFVEHPCRGRHQVSSRRSGDRRQPAPGDR